MFTINFILVFLNVFTISCSNDPQDPPEIATDGGKVTYEQVVDNLEIPWGMVFLPNGDVLVTERKGEILRIQGWKVTAKLDGVPEVYQRGQGGLLDIELHPNFETNNIIYLSYSSSEGAGNGGNTAIMKARLEGNSLMDKEILYKASHGDQEPKCHPF